MTPDSSRKLFGFLDQLIAEIDRARAGSDEQQFAILDLLFSLRTASAREPARGPLHERIKKAVEFMVTVAESGQGFTLNQIEELKATLDELLDLSEHPSRSAPCENQAAVPAPDEAPLVMNLATDADILKELLIEFQEHLDSIEQGVLVLEGSPTDKETLNTVFRAFHSFKGGAGFLNLVPISQLAHELESLLDLARKESLRLNAGTIDLILEGADLLKQFVVEMQAQLASQKPPEPFIVPTEPLKAKLKAVTAGGTTDAPPPPPKQAAPPNDPAKPAAPPSTGPPLPIAVADPSALISPGPAQPSACLKVPEPKSAPQTRAVASSEKSKSQTTATSVKIDTAKLDALVDLVGELVIAQSFVAQHPELKAITNQFFTRSLSQLGRITKELQRTAMSMRMVPVAGAFQKMLRVVRDLAAKQQKQVRLVLTGEETELDRTIVEDISDPLMHMIRNSVDHGIEAPDVRTALGKPPEGVIQLRAFHQGGNIVIQIEDDGNGLNREKIIAKAVEKGLLSSAGELSDSEVFQLIFAPGFSTADVITDVSGRGVGMDVVKRNIQKLHGKIEIESQPGQGSTFSIYLPLTLAIIEALVVSVGDQRFIIPALAVRESFQLTPRMLSTVYNRGEMVKVRDRLIPLLRLYEHFGIQPRSTDPSGGIVIVLEAGRSTRCLLVDQLLHKQEVVIKGLGESLKRNRSLAGAAILGDGRVGLILDVNTLVQLKPVAVPIAA